MSPEKIQELARDIAREQYTDDTPRNPSECYPGVVTYPFS